MFGILMAGAGALLSEVSSAIGKWEIREKKETLFLMGFLSLFWTTLIFFIIAAIRGSFVFSVESLPTFIPRIFLEAAQMHAGLIATVKAERSTMAFITILSIPLLLVVDIILGYTISLTQIVGIAVIVIAFVFLFINHGLKGKGIGYLLFIAFNAVATISLFKYNITNFNSIEAEQGIIHAILLIYFGIATVLLSRKNPLSYLLKYPFNIQSISQGGASILISFGYVFAPASIIATAKRSFALLAAVISGNLYFHEKHFIIKVTAIIAIVAGLMLLA